MSGTVNTSKKKKDPLEILIQFSLSLSFIENVAYQNIVNIQADAFQTFNTTKNAWG